MNLCTPECYRTNTNSTPPYRPDKALARSRRSHSRRPRMVLFQHPRYRDTTPSRNSDSSFDFVTPVLNLSRNRLDSGLENVDREFR